MSKPGFVAQKTYIVGLAEPHPPFILYRPISAGEDNIVSTSAVFHAADLYPNAMVERLVSNLDDSIISAIPAMDEWKLKN